ncbi:MAG: c-type cytochrome [Planctomycetota bacterium]
MQVGLRKLLMTSLLASFVGQSALVYFDGTAAPAAMVLSEEGVQGRRLWHQFNCGVCHQIYGFGGFLGPDLTNAAPRLTRVRLDEVLINGIGQMPAFHLDQDQISAIEAYLHELNKTGVGVARRSVPLLPDVVWAAIDAHAQAKVPPEPVRRGLAAFRANCTTCHVPLQSTPLGLQTAPDLSTVVARLDDAAIRRTIVEGRPAKGMLPWPALGDATVGDLVAWLHWLHGERAAIRARVPGDDAEQGLPWWEYR